MAAHLEILDIVINKPFKRNLHEEINDYTENRMKGNQRGNFVKPKLQEAWNKITDSCVANALRANYINKSSVEKNSIAEHESLGSVVLEEIKSQKIQTRIRDLQLYEGVPEEYDTAVLE